MKRIIITSLLFLTTATLVAQQPQYNTSQYRAGFAKETLTVSSVSKVLTASVYSPSCATTNPNCKADYALISVETDCLRYWVSGDAPTSALGHKQCDSSQFYVYGLKNLQNLKMIRVTNDVTIQVSYFRFMSNTNQ